MERWRHGVLASCVAAQVLAGCAAPEGFAPPGSPAPYAGSPIDPLRTVSLRGVWKGYYACGQGQQAATVVLLGGPAYGRGTFEFSPTPGSPGSRHGIYTIRLLTGPAGVLLQPERWLLQPPGFVAVPAAGQLTGPDEMRGQIQGRGCGPFFLQRDRGAPEAPLLRAEANPDAYFARIERQNARQVAQGSAGGASSSQGAANVLLPLILLGLMSGDSSPASGPERREYEYRYDRVGGGSSAPEPSYTPPIGGERGLYGSCHGVGC